MSVRDANVSRPVCPKCRGFLVPEGMDVKCYNCGHFIQRDVAAVCLRPPKPAIAPRDMQRAYDDLLMPFVPSIKAHRESGATWSSITRLLAHATGRRLNEKTVYNHVKGFM